MTRRQGFTMVEVVAALGVFAIAFLSGFAAIATMMLRQEVSYKETLSTTAAMLILGRAAHQPPGAMIVAGLETVAIATVLDSPEGTSAKAFLADVSAKACDDSGIQSSTGDLTARALILKGGDAIYQDERLAGTLKAFTFNPLCLVDDKSLDMSEYRTFLITVTSDSVKTSYETGAGDTKLIWRQAAIWSGDALLLENSRPNPVFRFVGRYLYAARQ